jgi:phospholipid/cholesterol/gamma-HCH transport system substrate-binding protein
MKVSNETKIGALTVIAITLLILGFNFLKGKNLIEKKATIYIDFEKVNGLNMADMIKINGLKVGGVEDMQETDADLSGIVVAFHLTRAINIPNDSYAQVITNPLGSSFIELVMGKSTVFVKDGDTLKSMQTKGLVQDLQDKLEPTIENLNKTLASLDETVKRVGNVFDEEAKQNIGKTLKDLALATDQINSMLAPGKGSIAKSVENIAGISGNLKNNNDSITMIIGNLTKVSRDISKAEIGNTIQQLETASVNLNQILNGIKDGKGSLGMLTKDEALYKNLTSTSNSLNILLQDLRLHPKRYVQVSVFGKKDKTSPLMQALPDSMSKQ